MWRARLAPSILQERTIIQSSDGSRKDRLKKGEEFSVDEPLSCRGRGMKTGKSTEGLWRINRHEDGDELMLM